MNWEAKQTLVFKSSDGWWQSWSQSWKKNDIDIQMSDSINSLWITGGNTPPLFIVLIGPMFETESLSLF